MATEPLASNTRKSLQCGGGANVTMDTGPDTTRLCPHMGGGITVVRNGVSSKLAEEEEEEE